MKFRRSQQIHESEQIPRKAIMTPAFLFSLIALVISLIALAVALSVAMSIPRKNTDPSFGIYRVVTNVSPIDYCIQLTSPVSSTATQIPAEWCYATPSPTWTPFEILSPNTTIVYITATPTDTK